MAVYQQPMFQREMQKALSKASMRGQRPKTQALQSNLVSQDLQRKNQFTNIALSKKQADLNAEATRFSLYQEKQRLDDAQEMLPWHLIQGGGTALLSALEGRYRSNKLLAQQKKEDDRFERIMFMHNLPAVNSPI